jgi:hypothetical protein
LNRFRGFRLIALVSDGEPLIALIFALFLLEVFWGYILIPFVNSMNFKVGINGD